MKQRCGICVLSLVLTASLYADDVPAADPVPALAPDRGLINRELPRWLTLSGEVRWRGEGNENLGYRVDNDQHYLLQKYRFNVEIRPFSWLTFFGQLQDARATSGYITPDGSMKDTLDLHQAYVDIGHEEGWWDLKVGRQRLIFGDERLIGAAEWSNSGRVFDAARLGIHHGSDRVDLFASSVVVNNQTEPDHHQQGNNLHGIYGSFRSWIPGSKVEPFVLWRTSPTGSLFSLSGKYNSWTYGLRSAGSVTPAWNYQAEIMGQDGSIGPYKLAGWATMTQVMRNFKSLPWNPSFAGEYNYASGGRNINTPMERERSIYSINCIQRIILAMARRTQWDVAT